MITYKLHTSDFGQDFIIATEENGLVSWIPMDLGNSDYQRYLNPEAEQFNDSTPL